MSKQPVRLGKVSEPKPMTLFLHPAAFILAGLVIVLVVSALMFAVTGHAAVESGGMRNFLATGV